MANPNGGGLGVHQKRVLRALWLGSAKPLETMEVYYLSGSPHLSPKPTHQALKALVKRGLATKDHRTGLWRISDAGNAMVRNLPKD